MSREQLFLARAEVLTMSGVSMDALDRAAADAVIRTTVRALGGVRNCAAAFAYEFGEHPDVIAERMRVARRAVAALYGDGADGEDSGNRCRRWTPQRRPGAGAPRADQASTAGRGPGAARGRVIAASGGSPARTATGPADRPRGRR
jgi:hypothetical protein